MPHLHFTVQQLRRAYRQAGAKPACCDWEYKDERGQRYYCPLNVVYGTASTITAPKESGSPRPCIVGFLRGWDGHAAIPDQCDECFRLGAQLRTQLKPTCIGR
jgi:hypothetical protein